MELQLALSWYQSLWPLVIGTFQIFPRTGATGRHWLWIWHSSDWSAPVTRTVCTHQVPMNLLTASRPLPAVFGHLHAQRTDCWQPQPGVNKRHLALTHVASKTLLSTLMCVCQMCCGWAVLMLSLRSRGKERVNHSLVKSASPVSVTFLRAYLTFFHYTLKLI